MLGWNHLDVTIRTTTRGCHGWICVVRRKCVVTVRRCSIYIPVSMLRSVITRWRPVVVRALRMVSWAMLSSTPIKVHMWVVRVVYRARRTAAALAHRLVVIQIAAGWRWFSSPRSRMCGHKIFYFCHLLPPLFIYRKHFYPHAFKCQTKFYTRFHPVVSVAAVAQQCTSEGTPCLPLIRCH